MQTSDFMMQVGGFAAVGVLVLLGVLVSDRDNSTIFFWKVIFPVCLGCCVIASIWLEAVIHGGV